MDKCIKCGDYLLLRKECNCEIFTIVPEDDNYDENYIVYARYEEEAVEKYGKHLNDECDFMETEILCSINGKKYCVIPTPDIHYSVSEIE